jgi:hypothetical protein
MYVLERLGDGHFLKLSADQETEILATFPKPGWPDRYHNSLTNPENFPGPTCRACGIDREETGHLFAECLALSQTRYKILG